MPAIAAVWANIPSENDKYTCDWKWILETTKNIP